MISATKIRQYLLCKRLPYMNAYASEEEREERAAARWIADLGIRHEKNVEADNRWRPERREPRQRHEKATLAPAPHIVRPHDVAAATLRAMRSGIERYSHSLLITDNWWGAPDWLSKQRGDSNLGAWHYIPEDAKATSKHPRPYHIIPLVFYALQLERIQGLLPAKVVIHPIRRPTPIRVADHVEDTERVVSELETMLSSASDPGPFITSRCERCAWKRRCLKDAREQGSLSLLSGVSRIGAERLRARGITDAGAVATASPHQLLGVRGIGGDPFRLVSQAQAYADGRPRLVSASIIPPPSPVEIFVDLEGTVDAFFGSQVVILHGALIRNGERSQYVYSLAASTKRAELQQAAEAFIEMLASVPGNPPIFHYGAYDSRHLRRLAPQATDIHARLIDMLPIVRATTAFPVRDRGLKAIAAVLGLNRRSLVEDGWLAGDLWSNWQSSRDTEALEVLLAYNRDDLELLAGVLKTLRALTS